MAGCIIYAFSEREQAKVINLMSTILFINSTNIYSTLCVWHCSQHWDSSGEHSVFLECTCSQGFTLIIHQSKLTLASEKCYKGKWS